MCVRSLSVRILSSCCVITLSLWETGISSVAPYTSQGSRQRSELRCQQGCFRDDNSPPVQPLGTFFTLWELYKHTSGCEQHGGKRAYTSICLYCVFSLYIWPIVLLLSPSVSIFYDSHSCFFKEEEIGPPLCVIKVSHYHSDLRQTDVGSVSIPQCWE